MGRTGRYHGVLVVAIVALLVVGAVFVLARSYNELVELSQRIDGAWTDIDAALRRRHDLVPQLVATVRGETAHDRSSFEAALAAQQAAVAAEATPQGRVEAENQLVGGIRKVLGIADSYPDLRSSAPFIELHAQLAEAERRIQSARQTFDEYVLARNRRIDTFPSAFVARAFDHRPGACFDLEPLVRDGAPGSGVLHGSGDGGHTRR